MPTPTDTTHTTTTTCANNDDEEGRRLHSHGVYSRDTRTYAVIQMNDHTVIVRQQRRTTSFDI